MDRRCRQGKHLELFEANGDIILYKSANPSADKDTDLGEIKFSTPREFLTVPVFFQWSESSVVKKNYGLIVTGKPTGPGRDSFWCGMFNCPVTKRRLRVGTARNMPPGEYELEATFRLDGPPAGVPPIRLNFNVGLPVQPIVIEAAVIDSNN